MQPLSSDALREPAAIVAFSGWNDAGNAASDAVAHLLQAYPSEELARIDDERYYDYQATRPLVLRSADGPWLQWPATAIHRVDHPQRDLIVAIGPEPSLLWRSYARELMTALNALEPQLVVLMGALLSDTPHSRPLPVSMSSYDAALRDRLMIEESTYEGPTGMIGVLNQMLLASNTQTASIWAAVPHYVPAPPNPKAQFALLTRLEEALGVTLDVGNLAAESEQWTAAVDERRDEDPDVAEYIEKLEEAKDASDAEEATGDSIAAEFERYLRGRGEQA